MPTISERIDSLPMTRSAAVVLLAVGIGWLFDAMDQGMVSGVIADIRNDWSLSDFERSAILSSGIFGMIAGAALSGVIADRFGRRTVIIATLLVYSVGSLLCGLSVNLAMLVVFRFVTGLGLGGELPVASALVSELSPLRARGRNVVILESFWAWGWIAASLVAYLAIPAWGWRAAFFVGAAPALFAAVLRRMVPESPRYLESAGRGEEADAIVRRMEAEAGAESPDYVPAEAPAERARAPLGELWNRENRRATAVLWVIWIGVNFGYYGFVLWTPSLLTDRGFDMVKSFEFTVIMCLAQLPGYFSAAYLIEAIGRKPCLVLYFSGTAAAAWLYGMSGSEGAILATGCLLYFFALGAWGCVYSYTPEVYRTRIRGSGAGWASAVGRVGALVAPFIVPALYGVFGKEDGFLYVFSILSLAFALVAAVVAVSGRETKGVPAGRRNRARSPAPFESRAIAQKMERAHTASGALRSVIRIRKVHAMSGDRFLRPSEKNLTASPTGSAVGTASSCLAFRAALSSRMTAMPRSVSVLMSLPTACLIFLTAGTSEVYFHPIPGP